MHILSHISSRDVAHLVRDYRFQFFCAKRTAEAIGDGDGHVSRGKPCSESVGLLGLDLVHMGRRWHIGVARHLIDESCKLLVRRLASHKLGHAAATTEQGELTQEDASWEQDRAGNNEANRGACEA
eukprot:CAMPEP_0119308660 /NCGR_PEP_ID=MMETSP1333-20130426/11780_1 /TAXON_ID=418940 /ORGANISM="Scyphosphaera apsteinii, Strain RCC1455" /LENGTH=125 /DNA_ID=CAMNT_0007312485 /DNA_START=723 /DNA_END=1100 /DNA_ORIENTATION=+